MTSDRLPLGTLPPRQEADDLPDHLREKLEALHVGCGCSTVFLIAAALALLALLTGCQTTHEIVYRDLHTTDTLYLATVQRDSVALTDSTHVSETHWGDTIRIETTRWRTLYRDRLRIDTLFRARTDTLYQERETLREVPARLTQWQRVRLHVANTLLALLGLAAAGFILKKKVL